MRDIKLITAFITIAILSGCTPDKFPKHPDYTIHQPDVTCSPCRANLDKMVKQLQGTPYVWAEEGPDYFDCSGFTYYLYGSMGIELPRTAREQAKVGKRVSFKNLKYGDLIFFATSKNRHRITHVGMYLGNGWFTHASTAKSKVVYSNIYKSKYYKSRLRVCRRYLPDECSADIGKKLLWQNTPQKCKTKPLKPKIEDIKEPTLKKKAIVIQTPMSDIESNSKDGIYYVQVGSFTGNPNPYIIKKIKQKNLRYRLIKFDIGKKHINKLLIGAYKTQAQAQKVLRDVKKEIEPNAFIAEIR
jgi:hypothetical protein